MVSYFYQYKTKRVAIHTPQLFSLFKLDKIFERKKCFSNVNLAEFFWLFFNYRILAM